MRNCPLKRTLCGSQSCKLASLRAGSCLLRLRPPEGSSCGQGTLSCTSVTGHEKSGQTLERQVCDKHTHTHACFINCHFVFIRGRTESVSPKSIPTSNGSPGSTQTTEWLWVCPSLHCGRCGYHLNPALLSNTAPIGWAPHFPSVPSQPASPAPQQGRQWRSCSGLPAGSCPGDATQSNAGQAGKMLPNGF